MTLQTLTVFEQIQLTKKQLESSEIYELMTDLYNETSDQFLKYRLELVLRKWRDVLKDEPAKVSKKTRSRRSKSSSVFEAVIMDDDRFFKTTSVPELLHRLLKSYDKNYKVRKQPVSSKLTTLFGFLNTVSFCSSICYKTCSSLCSPLFI